VTPETSFEIISKPFEALAKLKESITPAQAEVQKTLKNLDSCFRRNDVQRLLQEALSLA
jgi:hypothetical protein